MTGFILINKPAGWTSNDVTVRIHRITGEKRVGHAGTLDPFATGLLIVGIGREATKRLDAFKGLDKKYVATMKLGATSDTQDKTGMIERTKNKEQRTIDQLTITQTLKTFIGKQEQIPPMYSAKKVNGKKLCDLARKGKEVERKPNQITIHSIKLLEYQDQLLTVNCHVSTGTYIRTLCHDIGHTLDVGAYCEELQRTKIGDYSIENALLLKDLTLEMIKERLF